jgi:hypothetical protein
LDIEALKKSDANLQELAELTYVAMEKRGLLAESTAQSCAHSYSKFINEKYSETSRTFRECCERQEKNHQRSS